MLFNDEVHAFSDIDSNIDSSSENDADSGSDIVEMNQKYRKIGNLGFSSSVCEWSRIDYVPCIHVWNS